MSKMKINNNSFTHNQVTWIKMFKNILLLKHTKWAETLSSYLACMQSTTTQGILKDQEL